MYRHKSIQQQQITQQQQMNKAVSTIELKLSSPSLINSLIKTHLIPKTSIESVHLENNCTITFRAHSFCTLETKQPLIVAHVAKLIRQLSKQLTYLIEEESCTIPVFHARNVVILNDNIYIYVGPITPFDINTGMISTKDHSFHSSVSPEMSTVTAQQKQTPELHYKSGFFSFGLLILSSILGISELEEDAKLTSLLDKLEHHPIKGTRIYWVLSQCFIEDPIQRTLLSL